MEALEFKQSSLRDFFHVLFKRKAQILIIFLLTVCIVVTVTFSVKPKYEATAQILVKIGRENIYVPPNSTKNQFLNTNNSGQINSEIELLKSRPIAEKVINSIGPKVIYPKLDRLFPDQLLNLIQQNKATTSLEKALLKFHKSLSVESVKKSDVIEISFRHSDPELAAQIVNKQAAVFLDEHLIVHKNMQSYDFFENQSMILKTKLELSEEALKTFKKEQNVTAINEEQRLLLGQLADLRVDLNKTISQEVETKNRIIEVNNQISLTPKTISQGDEIDHNPLLISRLAEKLIELQIQEQSLLLKYTPENRLVQNVREEVQIVQNKLKEQEQKRYGKSNFGPNLLHQSLQEILYKNQADQKALSAKKEVQVKQLEDYKGKIKDLNKIEVKLDQLKQAVDVNRQNYRLYLAKFEESRISDEMDSKKMSNVSMMGKALPPIKPVSPKILLNILLGLLMGGAGGLIFAFVTEYLDDSLENPEEVEEALSVPVLASIVEF